MASGSARATSDRRQGDRRDLRGVRRTGPAPSPRAIRIRTHRAGVAAALWHPGWMMPELEVEDLRLAGWPDGAPWEQMLRTAAELRQRGIRDRSYLLKLLERQYPQPDRRLRRRAEPLPVTEAIEVVDDAGRRNLNAVRRGMRELMRVPVVEAGALMPDACPAGGAEAALSVGGVIAARGAILPAAHSLDICCSVRATVFRPVADPGTCLDHLTRVTRFGPGGRAPADRVPHPVLDEPVWSNPFLSGLEDRAAMHLADQGDGNHFAFLGALRVGPDLVQALTAAGHDDLARSLHDAVAGSAAAADLHVLVTHHGSRGLGAKVFERGMKAALKATSTAAAGMPEAAAWLAIDEPSGRDYWDALQYVARWTRANHDCVHRRFLEAVGATAVAGFGNEHNFVWRRGDLFLHGKGATPAWHADDGRPLLGLIPLNMAQPILVSLGRDCPSALGFAPHGAGRNVSRTALMRDLRKRHGGLSDALIENEVARATRGIDVRWFTGKPDYSESPAAYKPADQIREQIDRFGLAYVVAEIRPLGSLMAGHTGDLVRRRREQLTPKQERQLVGRAERRRKRQSMRERNWRPQDDEEAG